MSFDFWSPYTTYLLLGESSFNSDQICVLHEIINRLSFITPITFDDQIRILHFTLQGSSHLAQQFHVLQDLRSMYNEIFCNTQDFCNKVLLIHGQLSDGYQTIYCLGDSIQLGIPTSLNISKAIIYSQNCLP